MRILTATKYVNCSKRLVTIAIAASSRTKNNDAVCFNLFLHLKHCQKFLASISYDV